MSRKQKKLGRGRIVAVQEQSFRLATEAGRTLLLRLHESWKNSAADLREFCDAGTQVEVEYAGEPGRASGVAEAVRPV